jgi:hypothetical protein
LLKKDCEVFAYIPVSTKLNRFKKWYKMIYSDKILKTLDTEENYNNYLVEQIVKRSKTQKNLKTNKKQSITNMTTITEIDINDEVVKNVENGLKRFCSLNREKFLERVTKGPPDSFRTLAYIICLDICQRNELLLQNLLTYKLDNIVDIQIKKDLFRTNEDNFNISETQNTLYRVLKAFANLDRELSYCQGMNFIVGFLRILYEWIFFIELLFILV